MNSTGDDKDIKFRSLKIINTVTREFNLGSQFRSRATYFFHKISKIKDVKAKNYMIMVALSLFLTFNDQKDDIPASLREIIEIFHGMGCEIREDELEKSYIKIKPKLKQIFKYLGHRSEDYLPQIIFEVMKQVKSKNNLANSNLNLIRYEEELKNQSESILKSYDIKKRGDADPYFLAVSVIYAADQSISYNEKRNPIMTQEMLSQATKCSGNEIQRYWQNYLNPHVNIVRVISNLKIEEEQRFEIGKFQNRSSPNSMDWKERLKEEEQKLDLLKDHFTKIKTKMGLVEARIETNNPRMVSCIIKLQSAKARSPKYINFLIRMPLRYPYRPPKASDFSQQDFIQKHHDYKRWEKDDPEFTNFRFACLGELEKRWENDGSMGVAHYIQMLFYYAAFDHFSIKL